MDERSGPKGEESCREMQLAERLSKGSNECKDETAGGVVGLWGMRVLVWNGGCDEVVLNELNIPVDNV